MGWLVKFLGPLGWLVDPVTKGAQAIGNVLNQMDANASVEAQAAAQVRIKAIEARVAQAQNAKEIRLATANFLEMRVLTVLIVLPFLLHEWLVGLDTNFKLHWGIPAFPAPFDAWEGNILMSFFGVSAAGGAFKAVAGAIALINSKK
jgi:hypothetical protein